MKTLHALWHMYVMRHMLVTAFTAGVIDVKMPYRDYSLLKPQIYKREISP